jgi:hypothetical protein
VGVDSIVKHKPVEMIGTIHRAMCRGDEVLSIELVGVNLDLILRVTSKRP